MRILFMGTPDFAIPTLSTLLEQSYDIPAVVTAPDKPRGRGREVSFTPVKNFCLKKNIPLLQPGELKDPVFLSAVRNLAPDLIVVVAFRILPRELFTIPSRGSINLHASLLPRYRGAAPINWAIINGETETGVTTFFLQERVDTGSVILQARVRIGPDETAGDLHDKLAEVGAEIVLQSVRLIERGQVQTRMQDDRLASAAPKIFREHCSIDWAKSAREIHNFVRGLSPVPCAWTRHAGKLLRIYRTAVMPGGGGRGPALPGTVIAAGEKDLAVQSADGCISILEIQQEGKKRLSAEEFLRGYELRAGDRFEVPLPGAA